MIRVDSLGGTTVVQLVIGMIFGKQLRAKEVLV